MTRTPVDVPSAHHPPIAIVGIGCRLPGGVDGPGALWDLLADRRDAIGQIPSSRFDVDALFDERPGTPGRIANRLGGYLDDIDQFDAGFFAISRREAEVLDPQQRLLLETSWEALEDAGIRGDQLEGSPTGVFVGMWTNEYESRMFADIDSTDFHMTTGTGRYAASGRISYFLDALGPSVTVDTACSSSLVAVHLASDALRTGDCDVALAGGATVIVEPFITVAYSQASMMAPDGRCKFGDAAADGYVRSEGAVMVALKRVEDALAAEDRIYAVLRGSAVTNDGRGSGSLPRPAQSGQEEMLRRAYARAGIDPGGVQYVEAHGTGTPTGDPVELAALGAVLGAGRSADDPCLVGSIKSNVGHTEGAAGAAGLAKLALSLYHGTVPASIHVREPNPEIPWRQLNMQLATETTPWPRTDGPRRGGVSAFGIAGTNAHVVVEEAPQTVAAARAGRRDLVLPISAADPVALDALVDRYADLLESDPERAGTICAAAATRRSRLAYRRAFVGDTAAQLVDRLRSGARDAAVAVPEVTPSIVFVFPGQGSQWTGMARGLLADDPVFAAAMAESDQAIRDEAGWSPLEVLARDDHPRLDDIDVVQPLLFAIEVALAATWRGWGIEPSAVVGHSMGEVAAAHVAGVLGLTDAVKVICRRSALLRTISGQGAMAVVDLSVDDSEELLRAYAGRLSIAVANSRRSTVISGDPGALDEVIARLEVDDVFCRRVQVDVASHSPQVDPLLADLRTSLAGIEPRPAAVPFFSTVAACEIDGPSMTADYWCDNLRAPVRFVDAVETLVDRGTGAFVELSPHPILLPAIEQTVSDVGSGAVGVASLRRNEPERTTMLAGIATLYEIGAEPDWLGVVGSPVPHVDLPRYPWQRSRFWHERPDRSRLGSSGHPSLGHRFVPADEPDVVVWERTLELDADPHVRYLGDHVVRGARLAPATFLVDLMCEAARQQWSEDHVAIDAIRLHRMLPLDGAGVRIQVRSQAVGGARGRVQLRAAPVDGDEWTLHAEGELRRVEDVRVGRTVEQPAGHDADRATHWDSDSHAAAMRRRGLAYGDAFCSVESCTTTERAATGTIVVDGRIGDGERSVRMLDAALQVLLAALPAHRVAPSATFVPVAIESATIIAPPWSSRAEVTASITSIDSEGGSFTGDISMVGEDGTLVATASARFEQVGREADVDDLTFQLVWRPVELGNLDTPSPSFWLVFSDDPLGSSLVAELDRRGAAHHLVEGDPDVGDIRRLIDELTPSEGLLGVIDLRTGRGGTPGVDGTLLRRTTVCLLQAVASSDRSGDCRVWAVTVDAVDPTDAADAVLAADVSVPPALASMTWGLMRAASAELPAIGCRRVDIGGSDVTSVTALVDELLGSDGEPEVVVRGTERWVSRLVPARLGDASVRRVMESDQFRVVAETPGSLDGLGLRHHPRREPAAGEVEIRVEAAGLNFIDVMKAMALYPEVVAGSDVALGAECAGVVVAVGRGVTGLAVGDEVLAITSSYHGTALLASYATLPADLVVRRPDDLSESDAAAIPVAYVTAQLALEEIARVREGDRVLIHSATGGVGLAAIEICRANGAEVLATAGNEVKRELLRSMGIRHVFDSRSTDFADGVRDSTDGRGVDVVLNSLAGPAIEAGLGALARGGRFVEIGKRDLWGGTRMTMGSLRDNQTFSVLDLAGLTADAPDVVARALSSVVDRIASGALPPLPVTTAALDDVTEVFRTMAAGDHVGKLVFTIPPGPARVSVRRVRPGVTYLISGGTGALGLATAGRLAAMGANHFALMARGAPGATARRAIEALEERGATVRHVRADVGDRDAVIAALDEVRTSMPPVAGVIHAAGTLADATIPNIDARGWSEAITPKVTGAVNLHEATQPDDLEFFVAYSSVAGVIGLPGQANYAAANAFLDAFARERRRAGHTASSVAWGPWAGEGLAAAREGRGDRLSEQGMGGLVPTEALDVLERLLDAPDDTDPVVMRIDAERWVEVNPWSSALFDELLADDRAASPGAARSDEPSFADRLAAVPAGPRRRAAAEATIRERLAAVLRTPAELIDAQRPFKAMGLDSLMALELRNRLERDTGLTLPATLAWNHPTVALLGDHLADRLGIGLDAEAAPADDDTLRREPSARPEPERADASATDLTEAGTEAELAALLDDELAEIDRLLDGGGPAT